MTANNHGLTKYYKITSNSRTVSIYRWGRYPERWLNGKWVLYGGLIEVSGMGGDTAFEDATEDEIIAYIKNQVG
jgi:hypothetical protein